MEVAVQITTSDYELALDLVGSKRFPERRPVTVAGGAVISSQSMKAASEDLYADDIIELGFTIDEDASVEELASWLHGKLAERGEKVKSVVIGGREVAVDEAQILQAIQAAIQGR